MHLFKSHDGRLWLSPFHSPLHSESARWACSMPVHNRFMPAVLCLDVLAIALLVFGIYGYESGSTMSVSWIGYSNILVMLAGGVARFGVAKVQTGDTAQWLRGYVPAVLHWLFVGLLLMTGLAFAVRCFGQLLV